MNNNFNSPNYQTPGQAPTIVIKQPANVSAIKVILGIGAALIGLLVGLIVLLLIGVETGPVALLIGLVAATIPVPFYIVLVLWIDRYEAEPMWMLVTAFLWGALPTVLISLILNTSGSLIVAAATESEQAGQTFGAVISAPIVEETFKAVILFVFFFWMKDEFDGVIDGIMYASMVGLGFATIENILYYGRAVQGEAGLPLVFIVRGMFAPFSHPLFTSLTGIGLGLARQSRSTLVKITTPILGLLAAIFMHSIWNGSAAIFGGGVFLITYILIMVPTFLIMIVIIILALRREGHLVKEFLLPDLHGGLLTQQEYTQLCSVRGRMGASYTAFSKGGVTHWRACRQLNQLGSELAFHRSRVARGISAEDEREREFAYQTAIRDVLRQLRPN